jgi:hypothetical protein
LGIKINSKMEVISGKIIPMPKITLGDGNAV